jgi:hypothetical protein
MIPEAEGQEEDVIDKWIIAYGERGRMVRD